MHTHEYEFEFLTLNQQKAIIAAGTFIDTRKVDDFNVLKFYCENSYYVEAYVPIGTNEIDFITLVPNT